MCAFGLAGASGHVSETPKHMLQRTCVRWMWQVPVNVFQLKSHMHACMLAYIPAKERPRRSIDNKYIII